MQVLSTVRIWTAHACAALGIGLLGVWLVGRIASDRSVLSQFFSWIPTLAVLVGLGGLLAVRAIAWRGKGFEQSGGTSRGSEVQPQRSLISRLGPWLALGMVAGWWLVVDIGVLHFARPAAPKISMRVLAWNATTVSNEQAAELIAQERPAITLLANTSFQASLVPVREAMAAVGRRDGQSDQTFATTSIRLNIISRFPMLHSAWMPLGVTGARERTFTWPGGGMKHIDVGEVVMAELDTREMLGRTTVVWLVDLPSDPDIPRARMMRQARATIDGFAADVQVRSAEGLDRALPPGPQRNLVVRRLQTPDIVGGDFNTPRGAWSLGQMVVAMRHARETAVNAGSALSYPRELPVFHIDHIFLREPLSAGMYRVIDPGMGRHRAQIAEVGTRP